jgi:hypothetical protein
MKHAQYRIAVETRYNGDVWYIPQVSFVSTFPFGIKCTTKWKNIYKCPHGGYEYCDSIQVAHRNEDEAYAAVKGFTEYRAKNLGEYTKTTEYRYLSGL